MAAAPHLLFIDDEATLRGLMAERLSERGFEVVEADSGERALELLDQFAFDIVITDLRLPGIDGSRVIEAARERYPGIIAIVITGFGTVKDAVDAIKRGASDFIAKPFQFDELMHVLQKAMEQRRLTSENDSWCTPRPRSGCACSTVTPTRSKPSSRRVVRASPSRRCPLR